MIVATAIRLCLMRMIAGRTYAQDRVYDSRLIPIEDDFKTGDANEKPIIIFSTEEFSGDMDGQSSLTRADRTLNIVFEIAFANGWTNRAGLKYAATDAALEAGIDHLIRQLMRVIQVDENPWSNMFKNFVSGFLNYETLRGGDAKAQVKFASRFFILKARVAHEPDFGALSPVWQKFYELVLADPEFSIMAPGLKQEIEADAIPSWLRTMATLGLQRETAEMIGIGPYQRGVVTAGVEAAPPVFNIIESPDYPLDFEIEYEP